MSEPSVFGRRLKVVRETFDLTQRDVSKKSGVDVPVISHYETGVRQYPSTENLRSICKAVGVSSDYLIGLKDNVSKDFTAQSVVRETIRTLKENLRGISNIDKDDPQ